MQQSEFLLLGDDHLIEGLQSKGYRFLVPNNYSEPIDYKPASSVVYIEVVPVSSAPTDGLPFVHLSRAGIQEDGYGYLVRAKYFA